MILREAKIQVNLEKIQFLCLQVEFLGYIVSADGIRPNEKKVETVKEMRAPSKIKELKMFLGITSYYRKFIQDYAKIAKPVTNLTRGEHSKVKRSQSKNIPIMLDEDALRAFNNLKNLLSSTEVLAFPDFEKPFNLTTDASNYAIGAVLSQNDSGMDRPIPFISRSLNKTEEGYPTNEKEMLAIIWALDNLRSYMYGAKLIRVYTDHQPLTFACGNINYNAKLKC